MKTQDFNEDFFLKEESDEISFKEELKSEETSELKKYRNFIFWFNVIYRIEFGFALLFISVMGVSFGYFFKTGNPMILFIGLIIHFIAFRLALYLFRKDLPNMKKERAEMRKVVGFINQELNSRKKKINL